MIFAATLVFCLVPATCGAGASAVTFERGEGRLLIRIEGEPVATYVWDDASMKRPYFAHLRGPGGVEVTRRFPPIEGKDATDHATMHPGLWIAFGDISGVDFWRNEGVVRHAGFVEEPVADAEGGRFAVRNRYTMEGRTICEEVCRIRIKGASGGYVIDWTSEFSGPEGFEFGDQEEMGLGVRLATGLIVTNGGVITDSEGRKDEKEVWGRQADWCDYSGRGAGILLMPDPVNFRRSWFHARDYGLMAANPFGQQAFTKGEPSRVVVREGETLTLRFRILVHDGEVDREAAYQDFVGGGAKRLPGEGAP